jgi:hypothetical protein
LGDADMEKKLVGGKVVKLLRIAAFISRKGAKICMFLI